MALSSTTFNALVILFMMLFMGCFGTYQYFSHVQQWGPAVLKKHYRPQISFLEDRLTIHGLWPTNETNPQPRRCTTSSRGRFFHSSNQISMNLTNTLHNSWPNYLGSDELFWSSQWISHGTCSYPMFNQPRREDVLFAINVYHNVLLEVEIDCIEGTIELLEIKVCLDHSGTDYINCPGIGSCGWSFKWLKYSAKKKKQPICECSTRTEPKISNISQVHDRFGDYGNNKYGVFLM
ncbi:unnamed protein product [Lathyrus oleraceus]